MKVSKDFLLVVLGVITSIFFAIWVGDVFAGMFMLHIILVVDVIHDRP